ncbi:MAG TPA: hypothetical protein VGD97_06355 [Lacunisphaera sp.]
MNTSLPGYLGLIVLSGVALAGLARPLTGAWWQGRWFFALLLGLTVVAAHAPVLGFAQALPNPDEAQLLAGALTLREHFAPWLSVDLSTAGPLSVLPLLLLPADFLGARWGAALCSAAALTGCFLALTAANNNPSARIAALPVVAFYVFMQSIELFQFSTEHVAIVLLAAAGWLWMSATGRGEISPGPFPLFVFGSCLGAAIMAKLQSSPCAAWLAAVAGVLLLLDARMRWRRRLTLLGVLAAGCLSVPLGFGLLALAQGVLSDLLNSYGLNNVHYVTTIGFPRTFSYQPAMVWGLNYLLKPVGAVLLATLVLFPWFSTAERRAVLVTLGLLASAVLAVTLPGRDSSHYWLLVLGPVLLASGVLLQAAARIAEIRAPSLSRPGLFLMGLALLSLPVAHRFTSGRDDAIARDLAGVDTVQGAGEKLRTLARPHDRLTVWGWRAELHVHSRLPQGTREAHTQWLIEPIPQRDYYRQRFLADLARVQPRFFADAVGPRGFAYTDRTTAGHETFPELRDLLARDYASLGEIEGVRLYIRHDH